MNKKWMRGALSGERYRVLISTDIGGSDQDDFQSMAHYLLYSDLFDTEGLISSPWDKGRKQDILDCIDAYEKDYPVLKARFPKYPSPDFLRSITKQGALDFAPYQGFSHPTEGSDWIIRCARRQEERPLYVLVWGLLEDLAQALHDAPDIASKIRVHYIAGPNKKWGQNAYAYIRKNFPDLWMIENNTTYEGWFLGGDADGDFGNDTFAPAHAAGHGALGEYFRTHLNAGNVLKMGDTPTVAWLLRGSPENPEGESWGGSFRRVNDMPEDVFFCAGDEVFETEVFSVCEIVFQGPVIEPTDKPVFMLEVRDQFFEGFSTAPGEYRIRFVPKQRGDFRFVVRSDIQQLNGISGMLRAHAETPERRNTPKGNLSSWWSDDLDEAYAEGEKTGAKHVSMWRREFLSDFAGRFDRCLKK